MPGRRGRYKLSDARAREIRRRLAAGQKCPALAQRFKVDYRSIFNIGTATT